ncbi:hypothetical protein PybrP1_005309 [[Pythium] brassicae (nom. inval.)]|nr:hypothetical protein PybrP1_005309 [[Pythium] brassicae (nom. inval.)]
MASMEKMQAEQMKQKEQEQMRASLVTQKARAIEDMVIQMAQRGQLAAKIGEEQLIDLLSRAGETEEKQRTKVTMKRRTYFSDDDDDDDDDF